MARPYQEEMAMLAATFAWVAATDLTPLCQAIRVAGLSPLRAIGSGGSLTGAHALANLHQRYTGHIATVATPLEAVEEPVGPTFATWLLSAGGGNVDVMAAAKTLILREPRQLGVLCGRESSPLVQLCREHPFVDLLVYPPPAGKDGFLATNSLLCFAALLTRAYSAVFGSAADWEDVVDCLEPLLPDSAATLREWEMATAPLWSRSTTLVLYGPSTTIGAIDLESKFTEAALGHIQIADYRNFAHGRHHWLAKRSETSAVLALVTDADHAIGDRTLDLIPTGIPKARVEIAGGASASALASLVAALRITQWAGTHRGIDPGQPGVPEFGRKLYRLHLPRPRRVATMPSVSPRDAAAIARKAGAVPASLAASDQLDRWLDALATFRTRLRDVRFAGIVLDYDGTVVDTRHRFAPPSPLMAAELARLAETGAFLGVASGRGASIRRDLQSCIPRALWPRVIVGYYNGAEVASLDRDDSPDGTQDTCPELQPLKDALSRQPELAGCARQENRRFQISLMAGRTISPTRLWEIAQQVVLLAGAGNVGVMRSGHSVDIVAARASKLRVISRFHELLGSEQILAIGDRGRWPGNDYQLLSVPYALGVDEVSVDPATCWHLGAPGQRGPTVTLEYLSLLQAEDEHLKFAAGALT